MKNCSMFSISSRSPLLDYNVIYPCVEKKKSPQIHIYWCPVEFEGLLFQIPTTKSRPEHHTLPKSNIANIWDSVILHMKLNSFINHITCRVLKI